MHLDVGEPLHERDGGQHEEDGHGSPLTPQERHDERDREHRDAAPMSSVVHEVGDRQQQDRDRRARDRSAIGCRRVQRADPVPTPSLLDPTCSSRVHHRTIDGMRETADARGAARMIFASSCYAGRSYAGRRQRSFSRPLCGLPAAHSVPGLSSIDGTSMIEAQRPHEALRREGRRRRPQLHRAARASSPASSAPTAPGSRRRCALILGLDAPTARHASPSTARRYARPPRAAARGRRAARGAARSTPGARPTTTCSRSPQTHGIPRAASTR